MTKEEAFDKFQEFFLSLRCGDNSCIFGRYPVGTNGGCRTTKDRYKTNRTLTKMALKWRELEKEVNND